MATFDIYLRVRFVIQADNYDDAIKKALEKEREIMSRVDDISLEAVVERK